jgi:hypothetical protein
MAALEREIQKGGDNGDNDSREEQKSHGEDLRLAIKPCIKTESNEYRTYQGSGVSAQKKPPKGGF